MEYIGEKVGRMLSAKDSHGQMVEGCTDLMKKMTLGLARRFPCWTPKDYSCLKAGPSLRAREPSYRCIRQHSQGSVSDQEDTDVPMLSFTCSHIPYVCGSRGWV
jgi:hypothetical protein